MFRSRVREGKDNNVVGLTSIVDRWQFFVSAGLVSTAVRAFT